MAECLYKQEVQVDREEFVVKIIEICRHFSDLHRKWLPGDKYDLTQTILEKDERRQQLKRKQSSDKKEEEEEEEEEEGRIAQRGTDGRARAGGQPGNAMAAPKIYGQ